MRISEPTVADGIALVAVRPPVFNMDELRGVRVMVLKGEEDSQLSEGVGHVTAVCLPHTTRSAPTMIGGGGGVGISAGQYIITRLQDFGINGLIETNEYRELFIVETNKSSDIERNKC